MNTPAFARLPITFDVAPLLAEVATLEERRWVSHFNANYHDGGWQGAALRSPGGDAGRLYPDAGGGAQRDTELMAACPQIAAQLRRIESPLRSVRILRLAAGSVIREHRDDDLLPEAGEARLHVALATNEDVEFYVDNARVILLPGECWYLDLSRPHRVQNRGRQDRIHLVIDCALDDWLAARIAAGDQPQRSARAHSGQQGFAEFRELVFDRDDLQEALRATSEPEAFMAKCVELGSVNGFHFGEEDVRAAMAHGMRTWLTQWVL
jgi:hypothetical protein